MISLSARKQLRDYMLEVTLDIPAGQCLALVGPTGCGKTTTLRLIAGLEQPDSGHLTLGDQVLLDTEHRVNLSPQQRHVGFVFQDYALFPHLSVLSNVMYGGRARVRGKQAALDLAREALRKVQLEGVENLHPGQLSGGQQQRVALARALASEARLLLMDEPLSALDAVTRRQVRGELRALIATLGVPTICVTHDVADAVTLGDVIGVMREGHIVQLGTRRQLLSQPRDAFVAEFLGINLLTGQARLRDDEVAEVQCGGHTFYTLSQIAGDVLITCHPSDIALSLQPPESSAMNVLRARVTSISHLGGRTRVTVENGVSLIAELTHLSEERLGLEMGMEVYASFKASALRAYT